METQQERLIRYLDDAWAFEKALVDNLRAMADDVNDPQVRTMFEQHAQVTKDQEEALEARIRALGDEPNGTKGWFNRMVAWVGEAVQGRAHDEYDKTTQNLMKAFGIENFEIAMYTALESYASTIGDTETVQLAVSHRMQEEQTRDMIFPLIATVAARPAGVTSDGQVSSSRAA
jgi:ferritin-like metal-binding protein YciE